MSAHSLHWRVNRIVELMDERAWKEYDDYYDAAQGAAVGGGGFVSYDMHYEDFASPVDPWRLFQPFLDMPQPESFDDEIAQLRNARQNIGDAYEWLDLLSADATSWFPSTSGGLFHDYIPKLKSALSDHFQLLTDLETLLMTYRDLLEEAWKAAKQLASRIIEKLKHMDSHDDFDWSTLLHLGLAVAGGLTFVADPPAGAALMIIGATSQVVDIAEKGNSVVGEIAVHGSTVREVMDTAKTAVHKLKSGIQAKGDTIAQTLDRVPAVLAAATAQLIPTPLALPH